MFEHIKFSPFFPHNNQVPHFTEAETGGKICFLLLCYTLNMSKNLSPACGWFILLNAVIGLFLIIIFLFVRFRRYTVCLSVIKYAIQPKFDREGERRWFKEHRIAEGEGLGRISDILFYFCFL